MKSFCPHCGSLVNYVGAKPKFCSSCGGGLDSFAEKTETPVETINEIEAEEIEEIEEGYEPLPDISALEVEIQRFEIPKQTIGQILEANKDKESPED